MGFAQSTETLKYPHSLWLNIALLHGEGFNRVLAHPTVGLPQHSSTPQLVFNRVLAHPTVLGLRTSPLSRPSGRGGGQHGEGITFPFPSVVRAYTSHNKLKYLSMVRLSYPTTSLMTRLTAFICTKPPL